MSRLLSFVLFGILIIPASALCADPTFDISGKVVDEESEEPIKKFRIDRVSWDPNDERVHWNEYVIPGKTVAHEKPGEYHFTSSPQPRPDLLHLRFVARGYESVVTRKILPTEGPITLDIRLKRLPADGSAEICGQILTPGKRPAAWTNVGVAKAGQYSNIWVNDGQLGGVPGVSAYTETDEEGRFTFGLQQHQMKPDDPYCIVFVHETGFAELDGADFDTTHRQYGEKQGKPVELVPWGRVEGTVALSGLNPSERDIELRMDDFRTEKFKQWDAPHVTYSYSAKTDTQGNFVFKRVPPKKGSVYVRDLAARRYVKVFEKKMTVEPGKTTKIILGGTGRPVIGRLEFPDGLETHEHADWKNVTLEASFKTSEKSDVSTCGAMVESDGTFRIEDAPSGKGTLWAHWYGPKPANQLGAARMEIDIPELPEGVTKSSEAVDIGTLKLKPQKNNGSSTPPQLRAKS